MAQYSLLELQQKDQNHLIHGIDKDNTVDLILYFILHSFRFIGSNAIVLSFEFAH